MGATLGTSGSRLAAPESWVLAALVLGATLAQLSSATIRIDFGRNSATVGAVYRFAARPDSQVSLVLIRLPGQVVDGLVIGGGAIERHPDLTRIRALPDSTGSVAIRFRVEGDLSRIPIPVPSLATDGRTKVVELQIGGAHDFANFAEAFPRFGREDGRPAVARLASVPSVVQVPHRGGWPVLRLLDWSVVLVVIAILVGWAVRRRRRAARP